jgi:uncharacterized protein YndB with AHSA1/START domain
MIVNVAPEEMSLQVDMEVSIKASPAKVFAAVIRQMTSEFGPPEHRMNLTLELFPGGRWFRNLGDNQGHFWGHVQVIKQDKLLEICGPFFMSYPAANHLQFRLTPDGDKTLLTFKHRAFGLIEENHRKGVSEGWRGMIDAIRTHAESK